MEEVAMYSILDLFSSISGTFGLCLGMSVLSFIDIIELIFEIIIILFRAKLKLDF